MRSLQAQFALMISICQILGSAQGFAATEKTSLQTEREIQAKTHVERSKTMSMGKRTCTSKESWALTFDFTDEQYIRFVQSLRNRDQLGASLMEISQLQKGNRAQKALAKYWLGRLYFQEGFHEIAQGIFSELATATGENLGIQVASVGCLTQIANQSTSLPLSKKLPLFGYKKWLKELGREQFSVIQDAAISLIRSDIAFYSQSKNSTPLFALFKRGGGHDTLARAWIQAYQGRYEAAIKDFEKYLSFKAALTSDELQKYNNQVHMMLGQLYFTTKNHARALEYFRAVSKDSNLLLDAVAGQAWASLWLESYQASLGAGMTLRAPSLKNAFTPDAQIATAISYFELCRYPESYRALNLFRATYRDSFKFLQQMEKTEEQTGKRMEAYPIAVQFLKNQTGIPAKLGTELIRSPVFISFQSEINRILEARENAAKMNLEGYSFWYEPIAEWSKTEALSDQNDLIKRINTDLRNRLIAMSDALTKIGLNAEILEAETLRMAGDDLIWEHVNPKFREYARSQKADRAPIKGRFYDWGEDSQMALKSGEVWEDEIGGHLGITTNLCKIRDNYATN